MAEESATAGVWKTEACFRACASYPAAARASLGGPKCQTVVCVFSSCPWPSTEPD